MLVFYTFSYDKSTPTATIVSSTLSSYFGKEIVYCHKGNGAPYLNGENMNISLSHSGSALIFALSDMPVGIDIELRIQRDFARLSRKMGFLLANDMDNFYNAWTSYEARFKANDDTLPIARQDLQGNYTVAIASNDKNIQLIDIESII